MIKELKEETIKNLKESFLKDSRPWVVTFSGGKDSTTVLHLVIEMFLSLSNKEKKPIFIIANDTMVEMPVVERYLDEKIKSIENFIKNNKLDKWINIKKIEPEETFFQLMIGRGYPPPNRTFRWCSSKLKIKPTTAYLEKILEKYKSLIILLGTRKAESINRKRSIEKREYNFRNFSKHELLPNTFLFSPIVDWTNEEVWEFLRTNKAPWGTHEDLLSMYEKGSQEDCNVTLNPDAPSCGRTRFGCWVCTVVNKDKSMENMLQNGEEWMKPLWEYRNMLVDYREDPEKRSKIRRNRTNGLGPFKLDIRKELLYKLLEIEQRINTKLISDREILLIQEEWKKDGDFENSAIKIAKKFDRLKNVDFKYSFLDEEDINLIKKNELEPGYIDEILKIEKDANKFLRRHNILKNLESLVESSVVKKLFY